MLGISLDVKEHQDNMEQHRMTTHKVEGTICTFSGHLNQALTTKIKCIQGLEIISTGMHKFQCYTCMWINQGNFPNSPNPVFVTPYLANQQLTSCLLAFAQFTYFHCCSHNHGAHTVDFIWKFIVLLKKKEKPITPQPNTQNIYNRQLEGDNTD